MMSPLVLLLAFVLVGDVRAIVELDCNDNATCIEQIPKQLIVNLRQKKAVKIFDLITIEPLATRQARSSQDLWTRFLENHAVSFDLLDYTFQITPREDNTNALNFEVFESRTAKDVSDQTSKKSSSKAEEDKEEDKSPKLVIKRKHKKKVMQVLIPMLFGMKSAGAVIFAFTVVAMLTIKAFIASKLALMVTVGMALKKLYDSYGVGVGLQNHPYLYSQYPIDFPSASSHAYSMNGVSPQFASPDIYNPTGLGQSNVHDILQHDANAQPSQQAPTLQLINGTRAAERWDGKSKLERLFDPIIKKFRRIIEPIASVVYDAMPATFRGLNTATTKSVDAIEEVKTPREFLQPQPRLIAQRKNARKNKPKKFSGIKISLNRLKHNKDLDDYVKNKKYKFNYPNTYYYPRIKHTINPNQFLVKPNNSRLVPYKRKSSNMNIALVSNESEWRPIVAHNMNFPSVITSSKSKARKNVTRFKSNRKTRSKRSLTLKNESQSIIDKTNKIEGKGFVDFLSLLFSDDPISKLLDVTKYTKSYLKETLKSQEPEYYSYTYSILMATLDFIDGMLDAENALESELFEKKKVTKKTKQKRKKSTFKNQNNCTEKSNRT